MTLQSFTDLKSPDVFGISTHIVKEITVPLISFLNEHIGLDRNLFPRHALKMGRAEVICKKGDPDNPKSYRPINKLSLGLGRIFQWIIIIGNRSTRYRYLKRERSSCILQSKGLGGGAQLSQAGFYSGDDLMSTR